MKVVMIGTGYVGLVSGTCFAEFGADVSCVDVDAQKVIEAEINRIAMAKFEALVGGLVEVLVEGPSHRNPARYEGRTRTNKITVFEGSPRHQGQLLNLRIERVGSFTLYGNPAIIGLD